MLELCALGNDPATAIEVARELGGVAYVSDDRDRPFLSLVRAVTDDPSWLVPAADVGRYLVFRREMKRHVWPNTQPTGGVVAIYAMVRHPAMSQRDCDRHWRDVHAPLALRHHVGMCEYLQLSVLETFAGPAFDGFALCAFPSEEDLRLRFFDDDDGRARIRADLATFADTARSPRRVLARQWSFAP